MNQNEAKATERRLRDSFQRRVDSLLEPLANPNGIHVDNSLAVLLTEEGLVKRVGRTDDGYDLYSLTPGGVKYKSAKQ